MGSTTALLLLADGRLPSGGHAHSGGVEAAVAAGWLRTVDDLAVFLRGRLRTAGAVAAGLAAAACADPAGCARLDVEVDARMPSPAQRATSRQQGRALLRAARAAWPAPYLDRLAASPGGPHHAVALGAVAAAAGADPAGAAQLAGYLAVSGPAAAAVRLCGFDPLVVNGAVAALTSEIAAVAARAAVTANRVADRPAGPAADPDRDARTDHAGTLGVEFIADLGTVAEALTGGLPAAAAPRLDLLAEMHARAEVRLFAS